MNMMHSLLLFFALIGFTWGRPQDIGLMGGEVVATSTFENASTLFPLPTVLDVAEESNPRIF